MRIDITAIDNGHINKNEQLRRMDETAHFSMELYGSG